MEMQMHGAGLGTGCGVSTPSLGFPLSSNLHAFANPGALRTLSSWVFVAAS